MYSQVEGGLASGLVLGGRVAVGFGLADLLQASPTPHEILVKGVLMHRWAGRDGTYDELVAQRSRALAMLPSFR